MRICVVSEGEYENAGIVAVVREEDLPAYKEQRTKWFWEKMEARIAGYTGENRVAKVLSKSEPFDGNANGGSFGVRVEVLMGTDELRKLTLDESAYYEVFEVWSPK